MKLWNWIEEKSTVISLTSLAIAVIIGILGIGGYREKITRLEKEVDALQQAVGAPDKNAGKLVDLERQIIGIQSSIDTLEKNDAALVENISVNDAAIAQLQTVQVAPKPINPMAQKCADLMNKAEQYGQGSTISVITYGNNETSGKKREPPLNPHEEQYKLFECARDMLESW